MHWRLVLPFFALLIAIALGVWRIGEPQKDRSPDPRSPGEPASGSPSPRSGTSAPRSAAPAAAAPAPPSEAMVQQDGDAAYYADKYQGRQTASGAPFNQDDLTAASPSLPLGARALVIDQENGRSVEVTINDRGPGIEGRVIDLSRKAAEQLGFKTQGVAPVHIEVRPSRQPTRELADEVQRQAGSP
jgi:rare lipoprotein A